MIKNVFILLVTFWIAREVYRGAQKDAKNRRKPVQVATTAKPAYQVTAPALNNIAQACAQLDPVAHPEQAYEAFVYASQASQVPLEALYAIWIPETGGVTYGSGKSDRCDVMHQLRIRHEVGGVNHIDAMERLADRFDWKLEGMKCSCGRSTMEENVGNFGGSCGPFQFSAAEVEKDASAYGVDPMTLCGGAFIMGMELNRYYQKYGSWEKAIARHAGRDVDGKYLQRAQKYLAEIHPYMEAARNGNPEALRGFLTKQARRYSDTARLNQATIRLASY